jgi:heme/copper-type cytochrome/quinol oxidase subunit 1
MCKRKSYLLDRPMMAAEGGYEGQTVRLDSRHNVLQERYDRHAYGRHGGFQWWMLWLIWPLIGLAKWLVPLYLGAITAGLARLNTAGVAPFVALALIVIGLALIGRRSYND